MAQPAFETRPPKRPRTHRGLIGKIFVGLLAVAGIIWLIENLVPFWVDVISPLLSGLL